MAATIGNGPAELFHYTGISGLMGILEKQTLWATHFSFLNDTSEIKVFKEMLPRILEPVIEDAMCSLANSPDNLALFEKNGGTTAVVQKMKHDMAHGMYNALLGTEDTPPFAEPYIVSFCTVVEGDDRTTQHGLLSQWRAYGQEGGYAIVFDSARLNELLFEEGQKWCGYDLFGGKVVYSLDTDEIIHRELGKHIDEIKNVYVNWFKRPHVDMHEQIYPALLSCACLFKHWGFREENELRIAAVPPSKVVVDESKIRGDVITEKPRWNFLRAGIPVPCIHLFEEITQLPGIR